MGLIYLGWSRITNWMQVARLGLILGVLTLSACGFQLRSYSFSSELDSFALSGRTGISVAAPLRANLRQSGLSEDNANPDIVIDLMDQRRQRRSVSTAGQTRAAEYETTYGVRYRILTQEGEELLPATWLERERVYRIDRENIVGSSEEQALLERELLQDIAGQIIRTVDIASRKLKSSSSSATSTNSEQADAS